VEASGAQAKKQNERVVVARINTKRRRRRRWRRLRRWKTLNRGGGEGGGELRDPRAGSKGSYYNKFVGGLRSGNNSELRATLRMCLSLLLFKWKWKATSCNGCDPYLRPSLLSRRLACRICTPALFVSFEFRQSSPVVIEWLAEHSRRRVENKRIDRLRSPNM